MRHQELRELGLKVTTPRLKILEVLTEERHISAEELHQRLVEPILALQRSIVF